MKKSNIVYSIIFVGIILITSCSSDDVLTSIDVNNTAQLVNTVGAGSWHITYYNDSGKDETINFKGYQFTFNSDGSLLATNSTVSINGKWSISNDRSNDYDDDSGHDDNDDIDFNISFLSPRIFEDLSDDWDIVFASGTQIKLKDGSLGDGDIDFLTFEKF